MGSFGNCVACGITINDLDSVNVKFNSRRLLCCKISCPNDDNLNYPFGIGSVCITLDIIFASCYAFIAN